jgi:hypothetical protein
MSFFVEYVSVNGGSSKDWTPFPSLDEIKTQVPHELYGISSYYQVRVRDESGEVVLHGFRAGPGGTGETWVWRPANSN